MKPKKHLAILLALLPTSSFAADWKPVSGMYAVTAQNYLDPSADESRNSHFRLQLIGESARDLYEAIPVSPVFDECTGGQSKASGEIRCTHFKESGEYECAFSINLLENKIEYGVAC